MYSHCFDVCQTRIKAEKPQWLQHKTYPLSTLSTFIYSFYYGSIFAYLSAHFESHRQSKAILIKWS